MNYNDFFISLGHDVLNKTISGRAENRKVPVENRCLFFVETHEHKPPRRNWKRDVDDVI